MSNCRLCGAPAGFLHSEHKECRSKHDAGIEQLTSIIFNATDPLSKDLVPRLEYIRSTSFVSSTEAREVAIRTWTGKVDEFLHDHVITAAEEQWLLNIQHQFGLAQSELDQNGAYSRVVRASIIRDLLAGKVPKRVSVEGHLPFNFKRDEELVWVFQDVPYLEDRTRRQYVGASQGVSVRVMNGVYYRTGQFKGQPIERTERVVADTGTVATTTKQIYFSGLTKSFRVPYSKIVSFLPFSDGTGFVRDSASARPQIFITQDGWFTYNLWTNLARLQA